MKVSVRFICSEIVGNARNGEYELPERGTVSDLMKIAEEQNKTFLPDYAQHVIFMVNSKRALPETVLSENDSVTVLRLVYGG